MIFFRRRKAGKKLAHKTISVVIAAYTESGVFNSQNAGAAVGKGADNTQTNSYFYAKTQYSTGYVNYTFDTSAIPQDAQNISVSCSVKGGRENASQGKTEASIYVSATDKRGSTIKYTTTTSSVKTIDVGAVTRAELDTLYLQVEVAYYGGHIDGATLTVTYEVYE